MNDDEHDPDSNISADAYLDFDLFNDSDIIDVSNIGNSYITYNDPHYQQGFSFTPVNAPAASVELNEDGLTLRDDADIDVDGHSLKDFMREVKDRLCILEPNFEEMEHYPALRDAYEKYKLIEQLIKNGRKE